MSRFHIPLRLLAAFLCGYLFAFLNVVGTVGVALTTVVPIRGLSFGVIVLLDALFLSLGLGIVSAVVSMDRRNKDFIPLALLTGTLAVAGCYLYWLLPTLHEEAVCPSCFSHGPGFNTSAFLIDLWIINTIMVLVSSLATSLVIRFLWKHRRKGSSTRA